MDYCVINGYITHLIEGVVMVSNNIAYIEEYKKSDTWDLVRSIETVELDPNELEGEPLEVLAYLTKTTGKRLTIEARELFEDMLILKSTLKKGTVWPKSTAQRFFGKHLRTVVALKLLKKQGDGYGFFFI